ncbi:FAD/FMN-containing dehydrogenase [Rhodococcus sp. 27YEA15]
MASDTWQNWAGTYSAAPRYFATPRDTPELAAVVAKASARGQRVKAVGAGHSFTAVAATDGVMISLDNLSGIVAVDPHPNGALVTVLAGTRFERPQRSPVGAGLCTGEPR